MASAAVASADQTADLLEKMTLEAEDKAAKKSDDVKKPSDKKYGPMNRGNVANGQVPKYDRSTSPMQPDYIDQSLYYANNYPFFYGAYDGTPQDWDEYRRYYPAEGAEGVYGDNGPLIYHPYVCPPYVCPPYSPATSPAPTIDGQPYASQQYPYTASYPPFKTSSAPFTPSGTTVEQRDVKVVKDPNQKPISTETVNGVDLKVDSGPVPAKSLYSNPAFSAKGSLGNWGTGYQDTRFGFDTSRYHQWSDGPITGNGNQNMHSQEHLMAKPMTGNGAATGFMNRMFTNPIHSGFGYVSNGYDARTYGQGWLSIDANYRPRGRGNGFYRYGNENADGLNELNRGPRAKIRNFTSSTPIASVVKDHDVPTGAVKAEVNYKLSGSPVAEDYNRTDFPVDYSDAKFFIIKSYSEDDVHKSVKHNVWASTPNGNKKLDAAYKQAQEKSKPYPVFLFFSVNASGQFVGLAEMVGSVDFDKNLEYWQQDKWNGCFSLKWHIVKDVPNTLLKHIILENNESKPVTNSRDTQEVKLEQGLQMLKIFKDHSSRTSILDDFGFYEARQKAIQEKKVRMQFQKQVWEGKAVNGGKGQYGKPNPLEAVSKLTNEPVQVSLGTNRDAKILENGSIAKTGDRHEVSVPDVY